MSSSYIIFFIIFLIVILSSQTSSIEKYTVSVSNNNECGDKCTKTYGCAAFVYGSNNNCNLSSSAVLRQDNANSLICNKMHTMDNEDEETMENYKKNATYRCSNDGYYSQKIILNNKIHDISENPTMEEYKLESIDWNKKKTMTNLNPVLSYNQLREQTLKKLQPSTVPTTAPTGQPVQPARQPVQPARQAPVPSVSTGQPVPSASTGQPVPSASTGQQRPLNNSSNESTFMVLDNEHIGDYVYGYKCKTNISQLDCLKTCTNNSNCDGVEWNPSLVRRDKGNMSIYNKVCCPKKNINKVISRRRLNKSGKFYKKVTDNILKNKSGVKLIK